MAPMDAILIVFNVDIAFACHFVTPHPPALKSTCGIGFVSKNLSKMVDNSASYPFNSWCIDRLCKATEPS